MSITNIPIGFILVAIANGRASSSSYDLGYLGIQDELLISVDRYFNKETVKKEGKTFVDELNGLGKIGMEVVVVRKKIGFN